MVSFDLGEEIKKGVFRLVTSVGQRKRSSCGIEPQTFGFRTPIFYHWARIFLCPTLVARRKTSFFIFFTELKTYHAFYISIYKHYAIDIADPSSMQDACHMNFIKDLAHRGVSVAQW